MISCGNPSLNTPTWVNGSNSMRAWGAGMAMTIAFAVNRGAGSTPLGSKEMSQVRSALGRRACTR